MIESREEARQGVVPSHAEQYSRRADLARQRAAQAGHCHYQRDGIEEELAADKLAHVEEGGVQVLEGAVIRPGALGQVHLQTRAKSYEQAGQNDRQRNGSFWLFNIFGQSSDAVETDVSQS